MSAGDGSIAAGFARRHGGALTWARSGAVALAIALIAAVSIIRLHANARDFSERSEQLSQYESQLVTVRSAGWSAVFRLTGDEESAPEALDRLQRSIPVFTGTIAGVDAPPDLVVAHEQYAVDLSGVATLIEAGQTIDARDAMRRADTRYQAMLSTLGEERTVANHNAARFQTIGTWGTVAAMLLATTFVWLISWNTERSRRKDADAAAEQLHELAYFDTLTNLPNRAQFMERLRAALEQAKERQHALAVLFLDLDNFKTVNDTMGHAAGDELIALPGARIRSALRPTDTAARLGGDEFAVIVDGIGDFEHAAQIAERVLSAMNEPFDVQGKQLAVRCSIGIAMTERGDEPADEIMRNADIAMYVAKSRGKARFEVYEPAMHPELREMRELLDDLEHALERGEMAVHYQPILDLATARSSGVEALVRWQHPTRRLVLPSKFLPLAEQSGLIVPIGSWVLRRACRDMAAWRATLTDAQPLALHVNVSPRQLEDDSFVADIATALHDSGLDPRSLTIEIAEGVMPRHGDVAAERLGRIRATGVRIAIDDFGAGGIAADSLESLAVDAIKVDRSLTEGAADDRQHGDAARAVIDAGRALGLDVIAEAIEHEAQADAARALGCTHAQGYHYARPMPADDFARLLTERRVSTRAA